MEIRVLDKGFVRLVEVMGDDSMIVKAARISTGQALKTPAEDAKLINYLVKNAHTSPLEMVVFLFHIKLPIFVMRQVVRHRTARLNEYSARYSELPDDYYIPELGRIKGQGKMNKQGSEGVLSDTTKLITQCAMQEASKQAYLTYQAMLANGVSRE
jgi:thymidylate synthase (FAD)